MGPEHTQEARAACSPSQLSPSRAALLPWPSVRPPSSCRRLLSRRLLHRHPLLPPSARCALVTKLWQVIGDSIRSSSQTHQESWHTTAKLRLSMHVWPCSPRPAGLLLSL